MHGVCYNCVSCAKISGSERIWEKIRTIRVYDDNDNITVLMDTCMLLIRGEMPQKEMIKIAKGLYRYKWD